MNWKAKEVTWTELAREVHARYSQELAREHPRLEVVGAFMRYLSMRKLCVHEFAEIRKMGAE